MNWYTLHVQSSKEGSVKEYIDKGKHEAGFEENIGQILIPTHKTFLIREGRKVEKEKKIFTSYIFIEADLNKEVKNWIQSLPGVIRFLSTGTQPQKLSESEVNRILGITDRDTKTQEDCQFIPGDMVKVCSGPFSDFEGVIEKINLEKKKLAVKVTVFGRVTPVEVNMDQVERID